MKHILAALMLLGPSLASAQGYVMGAGRYTCAEVLAINDGGDPSRVGQLAGWILGYWSSDTFRQNKNFVDIVEQAGGLAILELSIEECRKAPPEALLYQVTQSIINNTG